MAEDSRVQPAPAVVQPGDDVAKKPVAPPRAVLGIIRHPRIVVRDGRHALEMDVYYSDVGAPATVFVPGEQALEVLRRCDLAPMLDGKPCYLGISVGGEMAFSFGGLVRLGG